jgi:hypothetical protein
MEGSAFGPGDTKEERAIAQRRQMEAARLKRIMDPKSRVMGIDVDALNAQVAEKKAAAEMEKKLELQFDRVRMQQDQQLAYFEQERLRAERLKYSYVDQFNKNEMLKERAREYDLNDPSSLKNDLPGRVGDADPRLSVSGLQQFHGEDLSFAHRKKVQKEEMRQWCDDAVRRKAEKAAKEKMMDEAYAESAVQIDQMKTSLEATVRSSKAATNAAVAEYQLAQAAAKRERESAAQKAELQDNIEEIQNHLSSDILTENPLIGRSTLAPNRLRPDHYKGMAPEESALFREVMEHQRLAKLDKEARDKAISRAEDAAYEHSRLQGAYQDAQVAQMRSSMRRALMEENKALAEQQFASKSFLTSQVYTNAIDASFYDQWGKSAR